jgi:uncharacterized protein
MRWERVSGEGIVYSWERTHHPFVKAFADMLPYVNVLVELPDAGDRRLIGILLPPHDAVKIGARVLPIIQPATARTRNLPVLWWHLAGSS